MSKNIQIVQETQLTDEEIKQLAIREEAQDKLFHKINEMRKNFGLKKFFDQTIYQYELEMISATQMNFTKRRIQGILQSSPFVDQSLQQSFILISYQSYKRGTLKDLQEDINQLCLFLQETQKFKSLITNDEINSVSLRIINYENEIYLLVIYGRLKIIVKEIDINKDNINGFAWIDEPGYSLRGILVKSCDDNKQISFFENF